MQKLCGMFAGFWRGKAANTAHTQLISYDHYFLSREGVSANTRWSQSAFDTSFILFFRKIYFPSKNLTYRESPRCFLSHKPCLAMRDK